MCRTFIVIHVLKVNALFFYINIYCLLSSSSSPAVQIISKSATQGQGVAPNNHLFFVKSFVNEKYYTEICAVNLHLCVSVE